MNQTPLTSLAQMHNTCWNPYIHTQDHIPHHRSKGMGNSGDDGSCRICIYVLHFYDKLDLHAFQDWLTSLDDYFEWYGKSANCKVRFMKMKLKG